MKKSYFPFAYFNSEFVDIEKASISIMTNALQYGTAVFGGIRGYFNIEKETMFIFRPEDHIARLFNSLKILGVTLPQSEKEILTTLLTLIKKNNPKQNSYIRLYAYASSLQLAPNLARDKIFSLAMYMIPLEDYLPTEKGITTKVSSWNRISDNAIPARGKISGAYINSALARKDAADNDCDEAILLTNDGHVAEGSAENLFMVRNGTLTTPPITDNVLEGITRQTVIELAKKLSITVTERSIDRSELYIADELFFSGTGVQIAWITSVDGRKIGAGARGSVTQRISDAFYNVVYGKDPSYMQWLHPV